MLDSICPLATEIVDWTFGLPFDSLPRDRLMVR